MKKKTIAIIEIGSNNTKTHIYENTKLIYEGNETIEFKRNYSIEKKILDKDIEKLLKVIKKAKEFTEDIYVFGCSIFRSITKKELNEINSLLKEKCSLEVEVVSQEDEAKYTALGSFENIDYKGNMCIFIGGGGSTELIFVRNKKIIDKKYFDFGVVDITNKYPSLKEDVPTCSFDEVYNYVDSLVGEMSNKANVLVLSGGNHPYWYSNAKYKLDKNTLYESKNQKGMITRRKSDEYDHDAFKTSLDKIRERSDNPPWFDGCRAMKAITNFLSHQIDAKYIIPTNINMEDGLKDRILSEEK